MLIAIAIAEGIQGLGWKTDSLELKAVKAQIKNDEKQKAAQRATFHFLSLFYLKISLLEMSLASRFKNLYRGQLFIFCLFFTLKFHS